MNITSTTRLPGGYLPIPGEVFVQATGRQGHYVWVNYYRPPSDCANAVTHPAAHGINLVTLPGSGEYNVPLYFEVHPSAQAAAGLLRLEMCQAFGVELGQAVVDACGRTENTLLSFGGQEYWREGGVADILERRVDRVLGTGFELTREAAQVWVYYYTGFVEYAPDGGRKKFVEASRDAFRRRYAHLL